MQSLNLPTLLIIAFFIITHSLRAQEIDQTVLLKANDIKAIEYHLIECKEDTMKNCNPPSPYRVDSVNTDGQIYETVRHFSPNSISSVEYVYGDFDLLYEKKTYRNFKDTIVEIEMYYYDELNRLVKIYTFRENDIHVKTTKYEYNEDNLISLISFYDIINDEPYEEKYEYEQNILMTIKSYYKNRNTNIKHHVYDDKNNLIQTYIKSYQNDEVIKKYNLKTTNPKRSFVNYIYSESNQLLSTTILTNKKDKYNLDRTHTNQYDPITGLKNQISCIVDGIVSMKYEIKYFK